MSRLNSEEGNANPFVRRLKTLAAEVGAFERSARSRRQQQTYKRAVSRQCSFCGARDAGSMRTCSLCRSVHYCDRKCQVAHYKAGHKEDCTNFVQPPLTSAFCTEPVGESAYARETVFGHGHMNGVGCWMSAVGVPDASQLLSFDFAWPLNRPENDTDPDDLQKQFRKRLGLKCDLTTDRLLTLQVLVQNRRKDKKPILVLGAQWRAISRTESSVLELLMKKLPDDPENDIHVFRDALDQERAVLRIANDPWDHTPRVVVANFNGIDLRKHTAHPPGVIDAQRGVVVLEPGQYAVIHAQFLIGDGSTATSPWKAMTCLESLYLPCVSPWDGHSAESHDRECEYDPAAVCDESRAGGVHFNIDTEALDDFYRDWDCDGGITFLATHFGRSYAASWHRKVKEMAELKEILRVWDEKGPSKRTEMLLPVCKAFQERALDLKRVSDELNEERRIHGDSASLREKLEEIKRQCETIEEATRILKAEALSIERMGQFPRDLRSTSNRTAVVVPNRRHVGPAMN
ncbi:hypothetical protein OH76DRAFT_1368441 [Lentinus brumalis]|uniref:MYND-type domain-containing protein n=1 Tax=Lentinus brumalis TaxID=2498619 RepID=A0A371DXZ2_9APHY|nr:hypothetical protein OH76DRAFT_1368441 [Polyporus brumalis]